MMHLFKEHLQQLPMDVGKSVWRNEHVREDDPSTQFVDSGSSEFGLQDFNFFLECSTTKACQITGSSGLAYSATLSEHAWDEPSPLGLTLRKTPSFLELVSSSLGSFDCTNLVPSFSDVAKAQNNEENRSGGFSNNSFLAKDKLKAATFPAAVLKVGTWVRSSRYEGEVVGKCYYAKRKLVWEVLENGLKNKIEVHWSAISAIRASFPENQPALLEIEVSSPPLFFRETDPQPRKHTLWQATSDFTGGEATICKSHQLWIAEGLLNKHYEKILQCDARLKALAMVEGGHIDPHKKDETLTIKEKQNVFCCEPDYQISIPNHSSSPDLAGENTEENNRPSNISCSKVDEEMMSLHVTSVLVSSPAAVNNTWTVESRPGNNDACLCEDNMELSDIHSDDNARVLSVSSGDAMPEYAMQFISEELASFENHLPSESTHMVIEDQSSSSSHQNTFFPMEDCATPFFEDNLNLSPWMLNCGSIIDGFSLAEISGNLLATFQGHANCRLNNNVVDEKPFKRGSAGDFSSNDLSYDVLESGKQCCWDDSGEDLLVNLPRIASLPQLFQVSRDVGYGRWENLPRVLERA